MSFTKQDYIDLIENFLKSGYSFKNFQNVNPNKQDVVVRHDVDFSVKRALEIAELERSIGIKSSYFFLTNSDFYNILEEECVFQISRIDKLGHEISIHFDLGQGPLDKTSSAKRLRKEIALFEETFGKKVKIISFHRPATYGIDDNLSKIVANTYQDKFMKSLVYFSDSRGAWPHGCPTTHDAFRDQRAIQILTHPIWWANEKKLEIKQCLLSILEEQNIKTKLAIMNNVDFLKTEDFD